MFGNAGKFYEGNYKRYMIIPIVLYFILIIIVAAFPGVTFGMDLQGGTRIILRADRTAQAKEIDTKSLEALLNQEFSLKNLQVTGISSSGTIGASIQFSENLELSAAEKEITAANSLLLKSPEQAISHARNAVKILSKYAAPLYSENAEEMVSIANDALTKSKQYFQDKIKEIIAEEFGLSSNVRVEQREISAVLGKTFWENAVFVMFIAFIAIVIVVFALFRKIIPSLAVIAAGIFDILSGLAGMAIFGIPLSLTTIPALMMLIGYSIATDILLTTRVLTRREDTPAQRSWSSFITGMTMTLTAIAALAVMLAGSYIMQISVIFEISSVILFGQIGDIVATWLFNAPLLLWYAERREKKRQA
ncbi:MAG: hypothetical protein HYW05_04260 [Candidatus Diapherotrites archaeon]|nr:hypothetical protein [Candidatus Diapherotrites archaeon]